MHHVHLPHEGKSETGKDVWFFLIILAVFAFIMIVATLLATSTGLEQVPDWGFYPYFP